MLLSSSRNKNIVMVSLLALACAGYIGYSKYDFARQVSDEIDGLKAFDKETVELIAVHQSEKSFTLELAISGVTPDSDNIASIKAYYDDLTVNYVCSKSRFNAKFDEGYQINVDIQYAEQPDVTFKKTFVSKDQCSTSRS